ncbi:hypothetical protein DAPPUDRAFT_331440 [Daphnia pulex]|uniref:Uncharacterized protein n=1 Tax=Daphnia pulex TaxID=6669 RepID=E9HMH9_DAPPU|nr:hypothetical protein DAPPUDRAFT_331440 [Daphnia pulex]|eukprot:EFX67051.1 hypothetical protein DAPPUDRAFT_331440 [Daphnia pulex]
MFSSLLLRTYLPPTYVLRDSNNKKSASTYIIRTSKLACFNAYISYLVEEQCRQRNFNKKEHFDNYQASIKFGLYEEGGV